MKKYNRILLISIAAFFFNSCSNELIEPLVFGVKVDKTTTIINDSIIVQKGTPLIFNFEGNPQFISYFSGEVGKEYIYYNSTVIPASEFDSCLLKFDVTPLGIDGNIDNTLFLSVSDKFPGISGTASAPAFSNDSSNIRNAKDYNWVDLTSACQFPTTSGVKKSVQLDLIPFLSKNIALQFKYQTAKNDVDQPKWTIANLKIIRYQKGKAAVEILASTLGFKQFDILNQANAYAVAGAGAWSKSNPVNIFMNSTVAGNPLNEDYLVSLPILINPVTSASKGDLVKNLSVDVTTFTYKYPTKGIYKATFSATNANYLDSGQYKQVSFIVKVTD